MVSFYILTSLQDNFHIEIYFPADIKDFHFQIHALDVQSIVSSKVRPDIRQCWIYPDEFDILPDIRDLAVARYPVDKMLNFAAGF